MPESNTPEPSQIDAPLGGLRVVVAGPGRVGLSLAHWLPGLGARLLAVAGRGARGSEKASGRAFEWRPIETLESADADVLILAVADPALEAVARRLAARPQAGVVLHVSGHFDASVLAPLAAASKAGSLVGSWHPLRAFTAPSTELRDAAGVTWAIDGDAGARLLARRLTDLLGGRVVEVSGAERRLYHLAASLAAGGVITVLAAVDALRRRAGLPDELMRSYLHLTRGALDQLPLEPPIPEGALAAAITGPAARGDLETLGRQEAALRALAPELVPLIGALNTATDRLRREATEGEEPAAEAGRGHRLEDSNHR